VLLQFQDEMVILLGFGALWASSPLVLVTLSAPASRFLLASSQDGRLLFRRRSWYYVSIDLAVSEWEQGNNAPYEKKTHNIALVLL
jgi:hypothetical protein